MIDSTLGQSKVAALKSILGSGTCHPMDTVLMLGYNNLQTGNQLPGFENKWIFTDLKNLLVGSYGGGLNVHVSDNNADDNGYSNVGLAPRFAPESKK